MADRVRLHITPFNADILDRYIPASLKPQATNISFHAFETFPERGFGYVELPTTEALKLKNKFNGMTLKGSKVKIEEAKKERKRKAGIEDEGEVEKPRKKVKSKKTDGVLEGFELPEGRIVKRGWTEDAAKKGKDGKVKKEEKKMKFKTLVPPNALPIESAEKKEKKDKKEKKERTEEEKAEKAERRARKKEALVKEFANTTKLNFPNSAGDKKRKHYEDGVGWVDEEGNVLEPEAPSTKRKRERKEKKERKAAKKAAERIPTPEPEPEVEAAVESESEQEEDVDMEDGPASTTADVPSSEDEPVSPSAASNSDSESLDANLNQAESNTVSNGATTQPRDATPTPVGEVVEEVDELDTEIAREVHPLEALYKRTDSKPAPIDTSFNFFAAGADNDDGEEQGFVPQTPHTKEDLEWRSVRSAAPTPDTAAIGKKFNFAPTAIAEDDEDDNDDDDEIEKELGEGKGEESEFRKWFYENRGDLNRGWKKRRKEERKVVRQRENRRARNRLA